jgi:hypothetical protein
MGDRQAAYAHQVASALRDVTGRRTAVAADGTREIVQAVPTPRSAGGAAMPPHCAHNLLQIEALMCWAQRRLAC